MRLLPAYTTAIALCLGMTSVAYAQKDSTGLGGIIDEPQTYGQVIMNSTWDRIEEKPETATRWPSWSEVTNKPSTFMPATHNHDSRYIPKNGFGEIRGHLRIKDFSDEVPMSSLYTNAIDVVHEGDGINGDDIKISTFNDTSRNGAMLSGRRH